jgi:hypothetical protein
MNGLQLSIPQRMMLVRITVIVTLVISMSLSFRLWSGARTFPIVPVFSDHLIYSVFHSYISILLAASWIASMFFRKQRLFIFISFLLTVVIVLADVNRLQTWFYICNSLLFVFLFYNGRVDDPNDYTSYFIILQVIFASVYFFCGYHMLNSSFIETDYADVVSPLSARLSGRQFAFVLKAGIAVPFTLMFTGLAFIISPMRYLAIALAILFHLALVVLLFPGIRTGNYPVWLMNVSAIPVLILLFSGKTKQRYFSPVLLFQRPLFYIVLAVFVVLPFFNNSGMWPDNTSFNTGTGNYLRAQISVSEKAYHNFPLYLRAFGVKNGNAYSFDHEAWCLHELHARPYPSDKVYQAIHLELARLGGGDVKETELKLIPRRRLLFGS